MLSAISYDPLVSIDIGPLSVSPHGLITGVGVVVGAWFLLRDVRGAGCDADVVASILSRAVFAALVGARVAFVAKHWSRFDSMFEVLRVWEGGASLLGGLTAALVVVVGQAPATPTSGAGACRPGGTVAPGRDRGRADR